MFFFFKQKTAYEMRISDWSSDVCSSDLAQVTVPKLAPLPLPPAPPAPPKPPKPPKAPPPPAAPTAPQAMTSALPPAPPAVSGPPAPPAAPDGAGTFTFVADAGRSVTFAGRPMTPPLPACTDRLTGVPVFVFLPPALPQLGVTFPTLPSVLPSVSRHEA